MRDGGFIVWDRGKELLKLDLNDAAKNRDNADPFAVLLKVRMFSLMISRRVRLTKRWSTPPG